MKSSKIDNFQKFVLKEQERARIPISGELQARLDYCEYTIRTEFDKNAKSKYKFKKRKVAEDFMRAFNQLRMEDKIMYYNKNVAYLVRISAGNLRPPQVPNRQMQIFAYTRSFTLKRWKRKILRLNTKKKILFAEKDDTIKQYNLGDYLFRGSKNTEYFTFVLEAINQNVHQKSKTVHIGFTLMEQLAQWGNIMQICIDYKHWERIYIQILKKQPPRDYVAKASDTEQQQKALRKSAVQEIKRSFDSDNSYPASLPVQTIQQIQLNQPINQRKSENQDNDLNIEQISKKIQESPSINEANTNIRRTIIEDLVDEDLEDDNIQTIQLRNQQNKNSKFNMDIFHRMYPDYNLNSIVEESNMEVIEYEDYFRVMQDLNNRDRYKIAITIQNKQLKTELFSTAISSPQLQKQYNQNIEQAEVKTFISSENSAIIYLKKKPFNKLYRSRDYLFVRHSFRDGNKFYIADKKIEHINYPPFMTIVRGGYSCVWGIFDTDRGIKIIGDLEMKNQGLLNEIQNRNLTMKFLKGFSQIERFVLKNKVRLENYQMFNKEWDISEMKNKKSESSGKNVKKVKKQEILILRRETEEIQPSSQKNMEKDSPKKDPQPIQSLICFKKKKQISSQEKVTLETDIKDNFIPQVQESQNGTKDVKHNIQLQFDAKGFVKIDQSFIRNKYKTTPYQQAKIIHADQKNGQHPIWKGQWVPDKKQGGIIFIDQKKIEDQKGVLKFVLAKIGKNLLSGKSVLSISLPVDIFSAQSNLELLMYSTSYAPMLIQPSLTKDIFEKFKAVIAFGLSMSPLYLNMQKPFNPILGETFQAWINGCPVYAEQISHHPPIGSLYFCGRGYRITAQLQSKVELHMNSGCGTNDGVFKFQFQSGQEICFTSPGGQISGLTYGDRKFNMVGKAYAWCKKQCLFTELIFNPNKKGFFSTGKQANPTDYLEGHIIEVRPQFFFKYDPKKKKAPTQSDIVKKIGKISGIWHKQIFFDEELLIDYDVQFPPMMQYQKAPLPSDANWREDIAYRRLMQVNRAQSEKQRLQNLQRADKKLRTVPKK